MKIRDHVYTENFSLHTHHCDPELAARFPFYCRAVQEGAAGHALMTGCSNPDLNRIGRTWVLSRLRLQVSRYLSWPDSFTLETWIQPPFKLFAPREARGLDSTGQELFRSLAYWVVIDLHRRRPVRPDAVESSIGLSTDRSRWGSAELGRLDAAGCPSFSTATSTASAISTTSPTSSGSSNRSPRSTGNG